MKRHVFMWDELMVTSSLAWMTGFKIFDHSASGVLWGGGLIRMSPPPLARENI